MAKVEIEIDDDVLHEINAAGFVPVRYGMTKATDAAHMIGGVKHFAIGNYYALIVEPKPDDSIPFPDWVPKRFNFVTVDMRGTVELYGDEPVALDDCWYETTCDELSLTEYGFDTSWVPAMPNGDWTKAKWRRL